MLTFIKIREWVYITLWFSISLKDCFFKSFKRGNYIKSKEKRRYKFSLESRRDIITSLTDIKRIRELTRAIYVCDSLDEMSQRIFPITKDYVRIDEIDLYIFKKKLTCT